MTDSELKYWAFLSYSCQDNCGKRPDTQDASRLCWGDWLHDALKNFPVPPDFIGQVNSRGEIIPERIHPIFQDEQERPEEADLGADVRQALEQSTCLIVICSPRSAKNLHVNEAVRHFKQLGRGRHILPLVVAGEPNASDGDKPGVSPEDECFVPALRHPVRPDGTIDSSRRAGRFIFVDARHGAEKREILAHDHRNAEADLEMAKIQLIALLIGVGFNGLWWREQKRHFFDLSEARQQAREAQNQVEETRRQLQEAQRQAREAQNQALENQNLPRDVHGQIQEAQNRAVEAQNQAQEVQKQLQEFQNQVRETQIQLEEARSRVLAAESKVLEAQHQAREARNQLQETQNQVREAQSQVQETQSQEVSNQIQEAQRQLENARQQARDAQAKLLAAQSEIQEFQNQARSAQSQLEKDRSQIREAQHQAQEIQNQNRDAQNQIQLIQTKSRNARRLVKVFALLAALALLSAGFAASIAWRQRKAASQALAQAEAAAVGKFDPAVVGPGRQPIQQVLQNIGGADQDENRRRSLDDLAVSIPREEIPEALKASAVIVNDRQRCHFQKWLLLRLGWVNPASAMASASAIEGNIVNDQGLNDSCAYFQLAVLDNWMKTDLSGAFNWVCQLPDTDGRQRALEKILPVLIADNPQAALARLNDMKPAPDERVYRMLFQCWAAQDPVAAIQQRLQFADQDSDDPILTAILTTWLDQQPEVALNWVKSLPDSESKNQALRICMDELEKTAVPGDLEPSPEIMPLRKIPLPWAQFLLNSYFDSSMIIAVETKILSNTNNGSRPIKPND